MADWFPSDSPLEILHRRLRAHRKRHAEAPGVPRAAVALLVRPVRDELELLLIHRAVREGDPWSGHMALPGGRMEARDADEAAAAERETWEEIGVDLNAVGRRLGALDDVYPRLAPAGIVVSPFVYAVPETLPLRSSDEVQNTFWIGVRQLGHPDSRTEYVPDWASETLRFPGFTVGEQVVWGLTHRILTQFLDVAQPTIRD